MFGAISYLELGLYTVAFIIVLFVLTKLSKIYWNDKVQRWAQERGYRVLTSEQVRAKEAPAELGLSVSDQTAFRVLVLDANGRRRIAWIMFEERWHGIGEPLRAEVWEDRLES